MKIIGSAYEHDAISKYLNIVVKNIEELEKVLQAHSQEDKIVFWMMTNNLTGTIYNTKKIGELCHKYNAYYIMDCTASIGHNSLGKDIETYCDCLVNSAHKYYGPKGIGNMWMSDRFAKFLNLEETSHKEFGLIPGTPNVAGALAMADAMEHTCNNFKTNNEKYNELYNYLIIELQRNDIEFRDAVKIGNCTSAINSIILPGLNADALQVYLASRGIYVSVGASACADTKNRYRVLKSFGLTEDECSSTIRISFSEDTTKDDIDALVRGIKDFKEEFYG